jgi:hypothetical protein
MSDIFIPFVTAPVSNLEMAMLPMKVLAQAEAKAVFEPLADCKRPEPPAKGCALPSIKLQRQGDVVSGIRIECGCGQVIELACVY